MAIIRCPRSNKHDAVKGVSTNPSGCNWTFCSIRLIRESTKLIGEVADVAWRRNVRANFALAFFMGSLSLLPGPAWGWSNHGLATYWAFATMSEVASAQPVTVEPIEAFLREQEPAIEALLAAQENWARANLSNYPPRPAALAFTADATRDDTPADRRFWKRCALPPTRGSRCSSSPIHRRGSILHECCHMRQPAHSPSRP